MKTEKIPTTWESWCKRGIHGGTRKKNAVQRSLKSGLVRGYFSDIVLNPDIETCNSMYPSVEHLVDPKDHSQVVVEARIINDMKSHLSEEEFWRVIEHLFGIGIEKGKIKAPFGKRLPRKWSPKKHYTKQVSKAIEKAQM
jgi:hypothetical protein